MCVCFCVCMFVSCVFSAYLLGVWMYILRVCKNVSVKNCTLQSSKTEKSSWLLAHLGTVTGRNNCKRNNFITLPPIPLSVFRIECRSSKITWAELSLLLLVKSHYLLLEKAKNQTKLNIITSSCSEMKLLNVGNIVGIRVETLYRERKKWKQRKEGEKQLYAEKKKQIPNINLSLLCH